MSFSSTNFRSDACHLSSNKRSESSFRERFDPFLHHVSFTTIEIWTSMLAPFRVGKRFVRTSFFVYDSFRSSSFFFTPVSFPNVSLSCSLPRYILVRRIRFLHALRRIETRDSSRKGMESKKREACGSETISDQAWQESKKSARILVPSRTKGVVLHPNPVELFLPKGGGFLSYGKIPERTFLCKKERGGFSSDSIPIQPWVSLGKRNRTDDGDGFVRSLFSFGLPTRESACVSRTGSLRIRQKFLLRARSITSAFRRFEASRVRCKRTRDVSFV